MATVSVLTSKTHGQYQTWLYQLQTAQSRLLLQGYSQVIPYLPGQFVALKPDLSFVLLKDGVETTLNVRMQPPFPGSVHLRQQQLFWGETDLKTSPDLSLSVATAATTVLAARPPAIIATF